MKRAVHFDFHTMPGIDNFGENFDAAAFAQQMADAHVEYVNMFARCNIGFSYYPTKVGIPYPNMKGNMLGDVVRECHKRGIGVTGYLNAGLNHEMSIRHPEWLQMNKNGQIYNFEAGGNFFRTVCHNTGYSDHLVAEIKEILELGVDGIFCDCFILRPCYCSSCMRDMLAAGIDTNDEKAVLEFSRSARLRVMETVRAIVPKNVRLFFNGSLQWHGRNINSHFEVECLPACWGYDSFAINAAAARPLYDEVIYMNGRFQASWGDFGGYKGAAAIENDFFDALTQGATPMLGDHLHPADIAEPDIYRDLGKIYERIISYEKWTEKAKFIPEIAILSSDYDYLGEEYCSAARMLSELKYSYDVIYTKSEDDWSKYRVLILPDSVRVDSELAAKLDKYLKRGGKIISTGYSGLTPNGEGFALPQWSFDYKGDAPIKLNTENLFDTGFAGYFKLSYEAPELADMRYAAYHTAIAMKSGEGNTSLAEEYNTYFDKIGWNGRHFVFYTPPKEATGNSVMAVNAENNVAQISFALFRSYFVSFAPVYKNMIRTLLERFIPDNLIKAEKMPSSSRVTLTGTEDYKLLHVKVTYPEIRGKNLGIVEEHTELCAGRVIAVRGEYKTVMLLTAKTAVKSEIKDGYTYITLPEIVGYDMFLLK